MAEGRDEKTQLALEAHEVEAEEPKKPAGKKEVIISDCPVHSVVVYPDRAEVSRTGRMITCPRNYVEVHHCNFTIVCAPL